MPSELPAVAVITRTKDRLPLLERAVRSVLDQTSDDWVHIIVNDGGESRELDAFLGRFKADYDGRLTVIHHSESKGMQNASNAGIKASQSEFVLIHDDDDSLETEFIEQTVSSLREAPDSTGGIVTQSTWVREEILPDGHAETVDSEPYFPVENISLHEMAACNRFPPIAFLYRRSLHDSLGLFEQDFDVLGDWDFNLRVLSEFDIDVINEPLARYHWRVNVSAAGGGNTVVSGLARHRAMAAKLRTRYLRGDLKAGKPGLGSMLAAAHASGEGGFLDNQLARLGAKLGVSALPQEDQEKIPSNRFANPKELTRKPRGKGGFRPKLANYESMLEKVDLVSFDIFDTLLFRKVRVPKDVFRWMERDLQKEFDDPTLPIYELRISAEQIARQRSEESRGHTEITFNDIYEVFEETSGLAPDQAKRVKEREFELEGQVLYINTDAWKLYKKAVKAGKQVVFISDMYLSASQIAKLINKEEITRDDIFVSSEWGCAKADGDLYERALRVLAADPRRTLHIGDNFHSDVLRANEYGILGYHYNPQRKRIPLVEHSRFETVHSGTGLIDSLTIGVATVKRQDLRLNPCPKKDPEAYWSHIGYEIVGPIALGFLSWIAQQAKEGGIQKLFFLARDGFILNHLYEKLAPKWGLELPSEYVYASRRLLNFAAIDSWDGKTEAFLMTTYPNLTFKDFFERIGLKEEQYKDILASFGAKRPGARATDKHGQFVKPAARKAVKNTFRTLSGTIITQAREEREKLRSYLRSIDFDPESCAIVDLGWAASSLVAMQRIFRDKETEKSGLRGFYLGTFPTAKDAALEEDTISSWLLELGQPALTYETVTACVELLEFLFCAPHPTIVGIEEKDGGEWQPEYGDMELDQTHLDWLKLMQEGAESFVEDITDLYPEPSLGDGLLSYAGMALRKMLCHPTQEEAQVIGALPHRVGFGGCSHVRPLAKKPNWLVRTLNKKALKSGFDDAFWKHGYLAQFQDPQKVAEKLQRL